MKLNFSGTRALLLGGSCQLALGLAEAMIASGIRPSLTYRSPQGRARIDERLKAQGRSYDSFPLDLACVQMGLEFSDQLNKGVDYLVDFAQDDVEGLVASADGHTVRGFFNANIGGRTEVIQQVARAMLVRKKGRMVYISSAAAGHPNPGQGFYAACKQAGEALYRNMGMELAARGVTTAILRPGYVDAGRGRRYLEDKARQPLAKVPLGRALTVREIVDAILFLLSGSAVGFNATVLTMDGGLSAGK